MRYLCSIILSAIIILCTLSPSAQALELIYPADKTVVGRSDFLVIKGGDKPSFEELTIDINGVDSDPIDISTEEYKTAFADFLILEPSWSVGKNTVIVKGRVAGKVVATARAEFFYKNPADPVAIIPKGFQPFIMHTAEKEALCAPCHKMYPSDVELKNAKAENNPCASCHARMFNKKFVHGPEGVFQCRDCHDSKSKPQRWQGRQDDLAMCGECHIDKIDDFKKNAFVHGPVATGNCVVCHDPHASDEPAQLVANVNSLCLGCHESVELNNHVVRGVGGKGHPLDKVKDPSRAGRQMACSSCHDAHSGASKNFFPRKITGRYTLCQECHQK